MGGYGGRMGNLMGGNSCFSSSGGTAPTVALVFFERAGLLASVAVCGERDRGDIPNLDVRFSRKVALNSARPEFPFPHLGQILGSQHSMQLLTKTFHGRGVTA